MARRRRKLRKCCICKKSPVWRGGDVKNPGPYCKKCYHKHVWTGRPGADDEESVADQYVDYLSGLVDEPPYGFHESLRFAEPLDVYAESLLGLPLGPDEEEWAWICRTARGESENRREPCPPPDLYPDEEEWEWICETFGRE
jgi:hypothetical protein